MKNAQKITQLQAQIVAIKTDIENAYPGRLSAEDIEDVSDQYQAQLEWGWYRDEQNDAISDIQVEISHLESLHPGHTYNDPLIEEIVWPVNSQGLRYVSEEVGYVDEDEEYR